ncbi:MAG: helix-turn-helix domain-containing protein [Opitutaceae bacterium]|jgi:LacI family transcriptional regulator
MPNQREIARELGIAQITVSRALSNSPLVTPETRKRVLVAAEKMGYRAHPYVTARMTHNEYGFPKHGSIVHIKGTWQEGESLPVKKTVRQDTKS